MYEANRSYPRIGHDTAKWLREILADLRGLNLLERRLEGSTPEVQHGDSLLMWSTSGSRTFETLLPVLVGG
jgi:hypothetical protein